MKVVQEKNISGGSNPSLSGATAELNFFRAYAIRAIERFLVWFGFVKYQPGLNTVEKDVVVKPLLWEVFDFD